MLLLQSEPLPPTFLLAAATAASEAGEYIYTIKFLQNACRSLGPGLGFPFQGPSSMPFGNLTAQKGSPLRFLQPG